MSSKLRDANIDESGNMRSLFFLNFSSLFFLLRDANVDESCKMRSLFFLNISSLFFY